MDGKITSAPVNLDTWREAIHEELKALDAGGGNPLVVKAKRAAAGRHLKVIEGLSTLQETSPTGKVQLDLPDARLVTTVIWGSYVPSD